MARELRRTRTGGVGGRKGRRGMTIRDVAGRCWWWRYPSRSRSPSPTTAPAPSAGRAQPFHIQHLRVRVNRITVIAGDGTPQRRIVIDREFNYVFEARDITDHNFDDKVSKPMGKLALQSAVEQQPELLMDLARERLRKSITEKLREGK